MATVLEKPIDVERDEHADLERRYRELSDRWPDRRVEVVNGRIVVRELTTGDHAEVVFRLLLQLMQVITERGWKYWPDVALFLGPQEERYRPDLLVVPSTPRMWGDDHVYGNATLLVVEVVSKSSRHDDHVIKPRGCAAGKVPLYLVVDTFAGKVRLFSRPGEQGYAERVEVAFGEKLELPDPWNTAIDTGRLTG
jgi:Uma2 family endonuclease